MQDSEEATYKYRFAREINVPKRMTLNYDGEEQTGVYGNENYTLTVDSANARIDEDGNAVATKSGTYTVTASLNDSTMSWVIKGEDDTTTTTKEDQVITFTIRHNHEMRKVEAKAESCEENGIKEDYWICDQGDDPCGKCFADEEGTTEIDSNNMIVPAGHIPGDAVRENVVQPTRTAKGHYDEVVYCTAEKGVVKGYNATTFGPNDKITREQLAAILYRYSELGARSWKL